MPLPLRCRRLLWTESGRFQGKFGWVGRSQDHPPKRLPRRACHGQHTLQHTAPPFPHPGCYQKSGGGPKTVLLTVFFMLALFQEFVEECARVVIPRIASRSITDCICVGACVRRCVCARVQLWQPGIESCSSKAHSSASFFQRPLHFHFVSPSRNPSVLFLPSTQINCMFLSQPIFFFKVQICALWLLSIQLLSNEKQVSGQHHPLLPP